MAISITVAVIKSLTHPINKSWAIIIKLYIFTQKLEGYIKL